MKVKLRVNRVAGGHRQQRGQVYDLPQAEARTLMESGRAEAVEAQQDKSDRSDTSDRKRAR